MTGKNGVAELLRDVTNSPSVCLYAGREVRLLDTEFAMITNKESRRNFSLPAVKATLFDGAMTMSSKKVCEARMKCAALR